MSVSHKQISSDRELHRYTISLRDFEKAKAYLVESRHYAPSTLVWESLMFSAIVSYCRPFGTNEKSKTARATASLKINDMGDIDPISLKTHERCLLLRNKALAHSEFELNPATLNPETRVMSSVTFSLYGSGLDAEIFCPLVERLIEVCHNARADYVTGWPSNPSQTSAKD